MESTSLPEYFLKTNTTGEGESSAEKVSEIRSDIKRSCDLVKHVFVDADDVLDNLDEKSCQESSLKVLPGK
ncbi:hypothetical protein Tco_1251532 [Tanacetum coccineum]